jgi:hypothetical protein
VDPADHLVPVDLALRLRAAGLVWEPAPGDRFVLPGKEMDDDVFVLSQMTIEVHEFPSGRVIGFNGVTEWALDSVEQGEALWLPAEHQLRILLGVRFGGLLVEPGRFVVLLRDPGSAAAPDPEPAEPVRVTAPTAVEAYAGALLRELAGPSEPEGPA